MGVRGDRREPRAQPALPLRARCGSRWAPCSPAAGWWCPGAFDPAAVTAAIEARAADLDVLRADPPAAALRALGRGRRARPVELPAGGARRRAVPAAVKRRLVELFPEGTTWEFYGSTEGQFTACRSEEWLERPGTVGRARPGASSSRRRRTARSGAGSPSTPGSATSATPRRPPPPGGRRVHRRRPGPAGRGRLPLPRRPPRGPDHHRRRERLPARGRERAPRAPRRRRTSRCTPCPTTTGASGSAPRWSAAATEAELAAYARERLSPPKRPKTWRFLDELPRTLTGKVRRDQL